MLKLKRIIAALGLIVIVSGCAISNTFTTYESRSVKYKHAIRSGVAIDVLASLEKRRKAADKQLYLVERARINHIESLISDSIFDFEGAMEAVDIKDEKAKVTATGLGAKAGSAFTNDSVIPYSLDSYEKVMMHHYQAINYIAKGDLSGAGIEIRRANFLQSEALEDHTREIAKVEEKAQKNKVKLSEMDFDSKFSKMSGAVGQVKNSFQNAYTFYLSGLVFEALDSDNDAYIDYKKALEINPGNIYIQNDLLRLSKSLGMTEDHLSYRALFKRDPITKSRSDGSLVVFYETGFVPAKIERRLDFINPIKGGFLSVAMPVYEVNWQTPVSTQVTLDGASIGATQSILDVYALAAKALKEEIPGMVVRQILRAITKSAAQSAAKKESALAGFAVAVFNAVSERADLRAWSTLPNNVQILRKQLVSGEHKVALTKNGVVDSLDVNIKPGKTTLVYVTNIGERSITRVYTL